MKDVVKSVPQGDPEAEVRRRTSREQGSIVGYCAIAFVFVALIVLVLCLTVFFKITTVEINGVTLYRDEQILGVGGIVNDENLVRTDTKLIKQRLEENLVFIESAQVEKKYPSTLIITVTEAEKAADIVVDNTFCTVSRTGRVLEVGKPAATGGIPVIRGFELKTKNPGDKMESSDSGKLKIYNDLMKILDDIGMNKITEIDLSSRSGITILYDGRITLEVGSSVDLDYKLSYFKAVIDSKLSDDFKGRLVYNGADSGISAIPDGAAIKDDTPKDDSSSEKPDDKKTDDKKTDDKKPDDNGGNAANPAATDPNTAPTDVNDYGYMQNNDNNNANANQNQYTDPNANNMTGYDPNAYANNGQYDWNNQNNQYDQYNQYNQYNQYDQYNQYNQYDQYNQYNQYNQDYTDYNTYNNYGGYTDNNGYTDYNAYGY